MENKRILVVDDDPQILQLLQQAFESKPWQVKTADSGSSALKLASAESFDLFIFDLQLPHLNGREVLEALRKRGVATPALMMSGQATPVTALSFEKLGCKALLEKPFEIDKMLEAAETAMSARTSGPAVRVLVVEDHKELLQLFVRVLRSTGIEAVTAQTGDEALERISAAELPFDFAMLDLHVPGLDGPQLVKAVAQRTPKTFIIVVTGEASSEEIGAAYRYGGDLLIRKPFMVEMLPSILADLKHQAQEKRSKAEAQEEYDRLPTHKKMMKKVRDMVAAPQRSKSKRVLRGVAVAILAAMLGLATLGAAAEIQSAVVGQGSLVQSVIDRLEGYLERDEARELEGERRSR
ncbi:MAG: response regulator [Planctomycetota bacterium]|nr:response regulator [Planctomycetota bacterium]